MDRRKRLTRIWINVAPALWAMAQPGLIYRGFSAEYAGAFRAQRRNAIPTRQTRGIPPIVECVVFAGQVGLMFLHFL